MSTFDIHAHGGWSAAVTGLAVPWPVDPTTAAPDNFYDRELPTDTRELKRIRNRIVILGLLGLAAVLVSWCAG